MSFGFEEITGIAFVITSSVGVLCFGGRQCEIQRNVIKKFLDEFQMLNVNLPSFRKLQFKPSDG